ncbi:MAG: E3 binding domain-containing protein, partial [Chloroflexota bacterium]|nr:E3 binding domain-containing protein [Chloroflexota bacterium]
MSAEIRVPELGESIVDATIATWLKKEGDAVRRGEALVELETDKVNVEVNAEEDGVLQKVAKQEGETVAVGEVLGVIGAGAPAQETPSAGRDGTAKDTPANGTTNKVSSVESGQQSRPQIVKQNQRTGQLQPVQPVASAPSEAQRPPSPLARRIAEEHNIDISQVKGSSPHGRVTREDVINYMEQNVQTIPTRDGVQEGTEATQPTQSVQALRPVETSAQLVQFPQPSQNGREERIRLTRRRQTIAQRLVEAQHTAAMLTTFNEIDMSAVMEVRARR